MTLASEDQTDDQTQGDGADGNEEVKTTWTKEEVEEIAASSAKSAAKSAVEELLASQKAEADAAAAKAKAKAKKEAAGDDDDEEAIEDKLEKMLEDREAKREAKAAKAELEKYVAGESNDELAKKVAKDAAWAWETGYASSMEEAIEIAKQKHGATKAPSTGKQKARRASRPGGKALSPEEQRAAELEEADAAFFEKHNL